MNKWNELNEKTFFFENRPTVMLYAERNLRKHKQLVYLAALKYIIPIKASATAVDLRQLKVQE